MIMAGVPGGQSQGVCCNKYTSFEWNIRDSQKESSEIANEKGAKKHRKGYSITISKIGVPTPHHRTTPGHHVEAELNQRFKTVYTYNAVSITGALGYRTSVVGTVESIGLTVRV